MENSVVAETGMELKRSTQSLGSPNKRHTAPRILSNRNTTDSDNAHHSVFDTNSKLDDMLEEFVVTHEQGQGDNPAKGKRTTQTDEEDLAIGDTPEDYSGISFGEDPNYDAKWECSFGEELGEEDTVDSSWEPEGVMSDIVFVPRELI